MAFLPPTLLKRAALGIVTAVFAVFIVREVKRRYQKPVCYGAGLLSSGGFAVWLLGFVGKVPGLSASGITTGLSTLGSLVGGGMISGIFFTAGILALGTYGTGFLLNGVCDRFRRKK